MRQMQVGHMPVGQGAPCFVIAEIGINHNGSIDLALELIEISVRAGANAVKFQKRDVPVVYGVEERAKERKVHRSFIEAALARSSIEGVVYPVFPENGQRERLETLLRETDEEVLTVTTADQKYSLEFGPKDWDRIRQRCKDLGVAWGVSTWDGLSVYEIDGFQPDFHKVASPCLTHEDLLRRIRSTGKPVILSIGGSTIGQVHRAVKILGRNNLVILQCTSTYPSMDEETNLAVLQTLTAEFPNVPIGYSGHERDTLASRLAVSMGAVVVERHITLDPEMPGSDQKASIDPESFRELVVAIREIESDRGTRSVLDPERWTSDESELTRVPVLLGSPKKSVLPRELDTIAKLRRVTDF